jgi:disulfide bond formation protein DsbB
MSPVKKLRCHRVALALSIVLVLILAACSSSDDSGDTENGDGATTTEASGGSGDAANGATLYSGTCQACHGPDGDGIDGLGKPLNPSEFVQVQSDAELVAFLKVGRPASDPDNTTGVDMAPKGGNPSLTDEDLEDLVAHLRTWN